ncbi:hypothetical protein [Patulibacter americanus]|uniref:hypothetical protein n=1 Tax=Patulibacter americanus TaxID=588672 RepID=UPI0003B6E2AD|nr:hypothetical protein [Patulibacter americanus]
MTSATPDTPEGRADALLATIRRHRRSLDQGTAAMDEGAGDRHRRSLLIKDIAGSRKDLDAAVLAAMRAEGGPSDEAIGEASGLDEAELQALRAQA